MSDELSPNEVAELLTASATWGEVAMLEGYLKNGVDPNTVNAKGDTCLHVASDVNAIGSEGRTPLHKAIIGASTLEPNLKLKDKESILANQINLVKLLFGHNASLQIRDNDGNTPKDMAIQCDFYECAEVLKDLESIEEKRKEDEFKQQQIDEFYRLCEDGNLEGFKASLSNLSEHLDKPHKASRLTPLMIASSHGHVDMVEYLIDQGVMPSRISDRSGKTALHFATEKGHTEVVKVLITRLPKLFQLDDSPTDGTSIHIAARNGHTEIVKLFLEAAVKAKGYRTPCKGDNSPKETSSLEYLDEIPPECFINILSTSPQDNRTPLHEAVIGEHKDIVELLVGHVKENGIHVQPKGFFLPSTNTPISTPTLGHLHPPSSPMTPATPTSTRTPSSSTPIDMRTTRGRTPLQEAVRLSNIDIADVLIKAGADINIVMRPALDTTANTDITALVESSLACNLDMVRFLLKRGATDARLKALTRVLRIKDNPVAIQIAGVLLCYNSTVSVDSSLIELRRRAGKDTNQLPLPLMINWAGKKLPFIDRSWIPMVLVEPELPKATEYCISQLNISDNNLKALPIEIFQIQTLQRFEACRNSITTLPVIDTEDDSGWECKSLAHVDLSHNELESVPVVLFKLPDLKDLTLNYNRITSIPIQLWSAPRLQKLHLQHNLLTSFPSPVCHRDSGIGTIEDNDSSHHLQASMSISSFPVRDSLFQFSPPNRRPDRLTMPTAMRPIVPQGKSRTRLQTSPGSMSTYSDKRHSMPSLVQPRSRLLELFTTNGETEYEEETEFEVFESSSTEELQVFSLESLDLSHNKLVSIPNSLACLAPKLKRLHLHHNNLKSLGCITDYPAELELLDASVNELSTAVAFAPSRESLRLLPCAQKLLSTSMESIIPSRCVHRNHRTMKKLGYLKLSKNKLVDLQLFRTVKHESSAELTSSIDESKRRLSLVTEQVNAIRYKELSKSTAPGVNTDINSIIPGPPGVSMSSDGSKDGDSSKESYGKEEVLYCLYPQLSTLDVGHNNLKSVPAHIQLISTLAVLTISYNPDIDTLPLELSNLEGLWSLEYEGVPLTNPSAEDLDRFKSAADKLLYMRSLLHDAKPNESMKLMLVGLQKQGKTTLLSRLREINEVDISTTTFNERIKGGESPSMMTSFKPVAILKKFGPRDTPLSTVGVDVGMWKYRKDLEPSYRKKGQKLRSVTFYTWDFGGQEEYYATHQCFLSFRSLYLVIFRMIDGAEGIDRLGPWLHNIQARAPDSPVIIIGTHLDTIKGDVEKEKKKSELREYIESKFHFGRSVSQVRELGLPQIKEVLFVGCPSLGRGEGVADLRMMLWDTAFSLTVPRRKGMAGGGKSKLLEQQIPSSYLMLQEEVRRRAAISQQQEDELGGTPVMKETAFRETFKHIIPHSRELDQAVTFLHDNGILLHYATPALNHLYFVDPQWLCDMLAHVVTVPEVNRFVQRGSGPEAGILKTSVLSHLYKGKLFPQQHRKEYIELLGKFEVALLLDNNRLLVPSMLAKSPPYTLHCFPTVFPRPPLANILTAALAHLDEEGVLSPYSPSTDPLRSKAVPRKFPDSPSLYRTGLLMRRFYFMTYVPSGFWPRLISRFLTSFDFPATILKAIGFTEEKISELIPKFISGESTSIVSLEWSYWTTGLELWYQGRSVLRVSEIRQEGTFEDCDSSNISHLIQRTTPVEPAMDVDDLSFRLNGMWLAVDQAPNTGLEILVPDYVCPSELEKQYPVQTTTLPTMGNNEQEPSTEGSEDENEPEIEIPLQETSWMSAQLLALTVEQIDTLLEDWYPGIGSKDGGKNMYSIPYVNRVIPCPYCVSHSEQYTEKRLRTISVINESNEYTEVTCSASPPDGETQQQLQQPHSHVMSHSRTGSNSSLKNVRRTLLPTLNKEVVGINSTSRQRLEDGSPPVIMTSIDPDAQLPAQQLVQASKFGFMIESCVAACRGLDKEALICPAHTSHDMDLRSLVPDLMFGDLPTHFMIDDRLLDQGKYVASGSFGEIYHGAVYPHLQAKDDEGMEVAIKIDKQDLKHFNVDNASKAYTEIRAEVAILKDLQHEHVITFIGIVLNPLCFVLEWAPKGSLQNVLGSYNNADARINPWTLCETARQVACGLEYLHYKHIVYYDLKSPNVLVFQFPSPDESNQVSMGYQKLPPDKFPVLVKIADMGISRKLTPGGVVGYKGTPAFMAPEILSYSGKEACTEKVDVFSFGMFMYELISLHFPFERQNLMHNQIEKLITDGDRPPLQTRELNNPLLFLDIMRWAWSQDYHDRPSATQLKEILSQMSVSHLVNAYPLQPFLFPKFSGSCVVTLPVDISQPPPMDSTTDSSDTDTTTLPPMDTSYHVHGDLQEEVWLCSEDHSPETNLTESSISIVTFQGKANFIVDRIGMGNVRVTCMACVNQIVWLGTDSGQVLLYDATTHCSAYNRYLAVERAQSIVYIYHLTRLRHVLVARKDGCLLLFDETHSEHMMPDCSTFDNFINATLLPVRSVFKTQQLILTAHAVSFPNTHTVWCGSENNIVTTVDVQQSQLCNFDRLHARPLTQSSTDDKISKMCLMKIATPPMSEGQHQEGDVGVVYLWTLCESDKVLHLWDVVKKQLLSTYQYEEFGVTSGVTDILSHDSFLYISTESGTIAIARLDPAHLTLHTHCTPLSAHSESIHCLMLLSSRVFPRQWLPKLIGRSNAIEYYRDLLEDSEIQDINSRMIGHHSLMLVSIGQGFVGVSKSVTKVVDFSIDSSVLDNFLLLWLLPQ